MSPPGPDSADWGDADLPATVSEAAVRLRRAATASDRVAAAWHASDVGAASALGLARHVALSDAPACLFAADAFGRARLHLGRALRDTAGDRARPELIAADGARADLCFLALTDLAYLVAATVTDVAREAHDPELVLGCSRAFLALVDAEDVLTGPAGHVDDLQ